MHRIAALIIVTGLMLVLVGGAFADPPPSSGAVERVVVSDSFGVFPDFEHGFWVFANIERADFCAWIGGGEVGPPPVLTDDFLQLVNTGAGAIVLLGKLDSEPIALHQMIGSGAPDPCAGSASEPWAEGTARVMLNDNDLEFSGGRTNSFGVKGMASVVDATGQAWTYAWVNRLQISKDGEFRLVVENFRLSERPA